MDKIVELISVRLGIPSRNVRNTIELLEGGATVPFISRYRKEATGSLDETQIEDILDLTLEYKEIARRKEFILKSIESQEKLTEDIHNKIDSTWEAAALEDIYLPFKPRRRTRAQAAREKGLEPLARIICAQNDDKPLYCDRFLNDDVPDEEAAIAGARDIIAEWVNEDAKSRNIVRSGFANSAMVTTKVVKGKESEGEASKYRDFFDWQRPLQKVPGHRILALRRGEERGYLHVDISPSAATLDKLRRKWMRGEGRRSQIVGDAVADAYKRLMKPSIENEFASISKRDADLEAIDIFAGNLRALLMSPPLGGRRMIAIDPGFRTGCKTVVLDEQGKLLYHTVIFPQGKHDQVVFAEMQLLKLIDKFSVSVVAIGSGTGGRETKAFIESIDPGEIDIYMVNEDGASVYSASEVAREEFPDEDVTVRGAVSIGRRLMDPLSELVKIDPQSIGVGQYQHDVDRSLMRKKLESVTRSCVNAVGVNLNIAGKEILSYVSGLGPSLAANIVDYRSAHGAFRSRRQLREVPRLGAKAFEQCAAFLRIPDAENPLDNSAVHPERYALVARMAADLKVSVADLIADKELRSKIEPEKYCDSTTGKETIEDILKELARPGRDPREKIVQQQFDESINDINDLRAGMELPGVVSNVTDFGAFIDLGIKTKGLVHVSKMPQPEGRVAKGRRLRPAEILRVQQHVVVRVEDVDVERRRISLSMLGVQQ